MFNLLRRKTVIGVDIGDNFIKIVEIERKFRRRQLVQTASIPCNNDFAARRQALAKLLCEGNYASLDAAVAVPIAHTFIKIVNIPIRMIRYNNANLEELVLEKIVDDLPCSLQDLDYDFAIMENGSGVGNIVEEVSILPDHTRVFFAAAASKIVNERTALLEAAKLNPVLVELEPLARLIAGRFADACTEEYLVALGLALRASCL